MEQYITLTEAGYQAALQYLSAALAPQVNVEPAPEHGTSSARLASRARETAVVHLREWTGSEIARRSRRRKSDTIWVLTNGTPELRDEMRAAGQSYIDPHGAVRVELPWLLIDRTDLDPVDLHARTDSTTDPFADRSSLILRTLLCDSVHRAWGIRELAQSAGVGVGTASRVVEQLHALDLISAPPQQGKPGNVQVVDPQRLLDRWTSAYNWRRNESLTVQAPIGDPEIFVAGRLPHLVFHDRQWALTLQAGAAFVARHAAWERVHVYVGARDGRELRNLAAANRWTAAEDGRLVLLRPYYRTSIWDSVRRVDSNVRVVSNLQLVLDLWHYPLRGREQAEIIIDRLLRPIWRGRADA